MIAIRHKDNLLFIFLAAMFIVVAGLAAFSEQYWLMAIPFAAIIFYAGWQSRNTIFFLLLITLPFSAEYNFSSGLGTDLPDEPLMVFVTGLFIAYWIYSPSVISKKILRHPLFLLLLLTFSWALITVLFSTQPILSVKFLLAKTWYTGAFVLAPLIIFKGKKNIRTAAILIAGGLFTVAVIALIRHYQYGFRFANINDAVYPFFRNHVNYSAMLVCSIPVLFAFYKAGKTHSQKNFLIAALVIVITALFFSYARGAWLALLAGAAGYWLIKKRMILFSYITVLVIVIAGIFWLKQDDAYLKYANDYRTTIFHKNFSEHLVATYKLKDVSTAERFYRWIAGVRMVKDNALTGYGPNTFYYNYKGYAVPAFKTWVSDNNDHSTVHNYFLLTAIEQGLPGLLFIIILFGVMLYYAQYLYGRIKDEFYKTTVLTTGVIVTMIIVVNFLSDLIETDKIGSLFFLCIATLIASDINTRKETASNSAPDIQGIS